MLPGDGVRAKGVSLNGLLFNDEATLRMDCGEVMDGVEP